MDSNDLERERGITILSKNTSITYRGKKINVVDTPGHADFGGEVERVLNMVDGVLLLVDSVEGPMPQTRFVLKKALELGHRVVVVVNKIDRPGARPDYVVDKTFDLFCDLNATDEQCEFPVIYASGVNGIAGNAPDDLADDLEPLFEMVCNEIKAPTVKMDAPLQMIVTNIDYDEHKGRIALGRVIQGKLSKAMGIKVGTPEGTRNGKVGEVFVFENFGRKPVDDVSAGDICALSGIPDISIGETILDPSGEVEALPVIKVEDPAVSMTFMVNTSPFAGKEGQFVTSRNLKDRLARELERNIAMKIEPGDSADEFVVSGRGTLHITILIETMRREGYEFMIGPPQVIIKEGEDGTKLEPYEDVVVDVPDEYTGPCVDLMGSRSGQMLDMGPSESQGITTIKYRMPTRGTLGLRNQMLTATRGTAVLNTLFHGYLPFAGEFEVRENGSLVAGATGQSTSYALVSSQERGQLFIGPGEDIYEGQIVGIHQRSGDLKLNVCKAKAATNIRSATKGATVTLASAKSMSLDDCVEYIAADELVEVTPQSVRMAKNAKMGKKK